MQIFLLSASQLPSLPASQRTDCHKLPAKEHGVGFVPLLVGDHGAAMSSRTSVTLKRTAARIIFAAASPAASAILARIESRRSP